MPFIWHNSSLETQKSFNHSYCLRFKILKIEKKINK